MAARNAGVALAVLLAGLVAASGATWARPAAAEEPAAADLYRTYCIQCHGQKGKGNGINVRDMSVQPRDHTDPVGMGALSDAHIFQAIKEGGPAVTKSVLMPPWGGVLSDAEIESLVRYLRTLCGCKGTG
jgi:cytochrome c oxidase cbb3-type subunit 3